MTKRALIIFARNPEAGKVKTRLAATVGNETALAVYKKLIDHTVSVTKKLRVDKFVFYADRTTNGDAWQNQVYEKQVQCGANLGERMHHAFGQIASKGYERMILIGTDCYELDEGVIMEAFEKLDKTDVVIGPACDGGYYLVGLQHPQANLFDNIHWSTPSVLRETLYRCKRGQLTVELLKELPDIDDENDLVNSKLLG